MSPSLEEQRKQVLELAARLTEARRLYSEGRALLEQEQYEQAADFITRAAEMGDSAAQCQLGYLYENGFFGEPDAVRAVPWYRKSADQGLPNGQFRLGACYQLGKGVEQDYEQAARLFDLAAKRGHSDAAECLKMLHDMGVEPAAAPPQSMAAAVAAQPAPAPPRRPEPKAPPEPPPMPPLPLELDDPAVTNAVAAYQDLAMQNNPSAQLKLGLAYHLGRSAPANPKLACFWVMRSMLAGDYNAAQYLQYCTRAVPPEEHGALQAKIFMWAPGQLLPQL